MAQALSTGEQKIKTKTIIKTLGHSEKFDVKKLEYAIDVALNFSNNELKGILLEHVLEKVKDKTTTSTRYINDIIESYLIQNNYIQELQDYITNRLVKNKEYSDKVNLLGTRLVTSPDYNKAELQDFTVNQIQIAANRYLQKDMQTGDITESMTAWFERVASAVVLGSVVYDPSVFNIKGGEKIHSNELENRSSIEVLSDTQIDVLQRLYDKLNKEGKMKHKFQNFLHFISGLITQKKYVDLYHKYFQYMYQGIFEPNTPTLMNAGTISGKCSACFTLTVIDNMHSIMGVNSDSAYIFQGGGGLGVNISKVRPKGANIGTTYGAATGPIELVLEVINFITDKVKSGGKRRGANMGLMEYWHPQIEEFITMKKKPGYLENFNVSVMFDSKFWEHYHSGTDYDLTHNGTTYGKMSARHLIEQIAISAWSSAEPGVAFKDNANKANPLLGLKGEIDICNPCLTGDTRLATDKGMIRMDELYMSGKQLQIPTDNRTINGNPEEIGITLRSAVPVFKTSDNADVWEVETEHGYSVKATSYHKFFVNKNGSIKMIELKDLKVGDNLLIQSDEGYFGTEGNHDIGLLLGLLESDGHINKNKNRVVLQFNGEDKQTIINKVLKTVNHILPQTKSTNGLQEIGISEIPSRNTKLIQSTRLYAPIVEQFGYIKGQVPEIVWKGTEDCVVGYLQGLFGMDGTVNISSHKSTISIRLNQSNKQLLQQVQQLLGNFGIFCKLVLRREACEQLMPDNKGGKKLYQRKDNYELIIGGKHVKSFYHNIGFCLESKNKKTLDFINNKHNFYNNDKYQSPIKSITYIGKESVYDTTEYQTHTILVGNVVTSQCAEQFMYDGESCTLGSINLSKFVREDGTFDWDQYVNVVHETTRFLNDVLEINVYPTEHIAEESNKSKRIGLGIMGLADLLFLLKIPYNSAEGYELMQELSKTLYVESVKTSIDLAEERGACHWYMEVRNNQSQLPIDSVIRTYNDENDIRIALGPDYIEKLYDHGIRNMWTTTIAPTGTISMIADCSSGLEPIFSLVFSKLTTAGKYYYTSELFKKALVEEGIYSQELLEKVEKNYGSCQGIEEIPEWMQKVFVTAIDLHWMDHVVAQSVWQNWIDNSISKCVAKGTLVQTNKGVMRIEDIGYAKGNDVFADVYDSELKVRDLDGNWKKVTKHYSGGKKRTVKVRLNNGNELEGTFIHRVMTDNGWKTLGQVEIGDLIAVRKSDYNEEREGGMKLPSLSRYQNETYLTRYNKTNSLTHMTPELAKILGMIVADGSINESSGYIGMVTNNEVVKQTFIDLVKQAFGIEVRVVKDKRRVGLESLSITSRPLARMYRDIIGHNARNKRVPIQILQGSKTEQKAFLEGLTLDGYIKKNKYQTQLVVYEGVSKQLRDEVASILYQNGMTCYKGQKLVNYKEQKQSYYAYNVIVNSNWIEPIEPHKQVPLKESKMMVSTKGVSSTDKYLKHVVKYNNNVSQLLLQKHGIEFDNIYFYKVTSKEDSESEVYDIEVEDTHSYLIDGVISHNTINMPYNISVEDVKNAYILAHDLGLKGIALFRDGSRQEQVLHVGSNVQSNKNEQSVQKDTTGTITVPTKNQVERKNIAPSKYAINYVKNRIKDEELVKEIIASGTEFIEVTKEDCPLCNEKSIVRDSGCKKCVNKGCGWSACSSA